jgi:hypothetical protein
MRLVCKVEKCSREVKYGKLMLCERHYNRLRKNGDVNKVYKINHTIEGTLCSEPDCARFASVKGKCKMHYGREWQKNNRRPEAKGLYKRRISEHRFAAEKALGKQLPRLAVIHHHEGIIPTLVICPNQAYHLLIHARMRRLG